MSPAPTQTWKLAPSDFAFLWEECHRCFYLKVVNQFYRPRTPFPAVFTAIDRQMKACLQGQRTEAVLPDMPAGLILPGENHVRSQPIVLPNRQGTCFISGFYDTLVKFDDGTYGVIDFKTVEANSEHLPLYGRQLHAYARALEKPADGFFGVGPISRFGLLLFIPENFSNGGGNARPGAVSLNGSLRWVEISRDDEAFAQFIGEVLDVLEQPQPPLGSAACAWCRLWWGRRMPYPNELVNAAS